MKKLSFLIAPVAMACMAAFIQPAMAEPKSVADLKQQNGEKTSLNMNYQADDSSKLLTQFRGGYSDAIGDTTWEPWVKVQPRTRYNCRQRPGSDDHMKWCILVDGDKDGSIDNWSCYLTGMRGFENSEHRNADAQIYRGRSRRNTTPVPSAPYITGSGDTLRSTFYGVGEDPMNGFLPDGGDSKNKIWLVVRSHAAWYDAIFTQVGWECIKFNRE